MRALRCRYQPPADAVEEEEEEERRFCRGDSFRSGGSCGLGGAEG